MNKKKQTMEDYDDEKLKDLLKKFGDLNYRIQKSLKPLSDLQAYFNNLHKQMEPLIKLSDTIQEFGKKLLEGLRRNFNEGLDGLVPPRQYDPKKTVFSDNVYRFANWLATDMIERDIDDKPFSYLKQRIRIGLGAHIEEQYYLSVFAMFSSIDGLLTWYYCKNNDCSNYPNFDTKYNYFVENAYRFRDLVEIEKFREKLDFFRLHRNEIMHGGKHACFDRNISTLALIFFVLIYESLEKIFENSLTRSDTS